MAVLLGRTTAGTTGDFIASGEAVAWEFTASASGDVATIWFHSKVANNSPATTSVELGIYSDGGSVPGSKLGSATNSTAAEIQGTAPFKVTLGTPVTVTNGTQYWLACVATQASGGFDFQGDASPAWSMDVTTPLPASWTQDSTGGIAGIIWGEDAAQPPVMAESFQAIPFF